MSEHTPCQGCHYITGMMIACLGICKGMTCQEDGDARAELWARLSETYATISPPPFHPDPVLIDNAEGNRRLLRQDQGAARRYLAERGLDF